MYRDGKIYDEIDKVIIEIFQDYGITRFPIDEKDLCKKMGVALIAYSEFERSERKLLMKKSKSGFFVKESKECPPTIYYNDKIESNGAIRFTIFHELKHYVFDDNDDSDDDLADYFAAHLMCPTAYFMIKGVDTANEIASCCGMSIEAARNACSRIKNHRRKYNRNLFDYEVSLIQLIEPVLLEVHEFEIIEKGGDDV